MKVLDLFVAALTSVVFVSAVMAQQTSVTRSDATASPAPPKANVKKVQKFYGTVSSLDGAGKTVLVKGKKGDKTFTVIDTTKLTRGGNRMVSADLREGMEVTISYKTQGDKMIATAIRIWVPTAAVKAAQEGR